MPTVVPLDALHAEGTLPRPDYVKIDVEDAEFDALRGARQSLAACQPTIFLATHSPAIHAQCCALLAELGYQLAALDGRALAETDELIARPAAPAPDQAGAAPAASGRRG